MLDPAEEVAGLAEPPELELLAELDKEAALAQGFEVLISVRGQ